MGSIRLVVVSGSEANKPTPLSEEEKARLAKHGTVFDRAYYEARAFRMLTEIYDSYKPWKIHVDGELYWMEWVSGTKHGRYSLRKYRAPYYKYQVISWVGAHTLLTNNSVGMPVTMREED